MSYSQLAQLELMNAVANITSQDDLDALQMTLSLFLAERAQRAIDKCGTKVLSTSQSWMNCVVNICALRMTCVNL